MNRKKELKGIVKVLDDLANENPNIPTDGVFIPIQRNPNKKEIDYYCEETKSLIDGWKKHIDDSDKLLLLESCEEGLDRIVENRRI